MYGYVRKMEKSIDFTLQRQRDDQNGQSSAGDELVVISYEIVKAKITTTPQTTK